jgi:hypothetical protein
MTVLLQIDLPYRNRGAYKERFCYKVSSTRSLIQHFKSCALKNFSLRGRDVNDMLHDETETLTSRDETRVTRPRRSKQRLETEMFETETTSLLRGCNAYFGGDVTATCTRRSYIFWKEIRHELVMLKNANRP